MRMPLLWGAVALLTTSVLIAPTAPAAASLVPAGPQTAPNTSSDGAAFSIVARNLHNPRGIDVAADGTVFVAEGGTGGPQCVGHGQAQACFGATGAITRITPRGQVDHVLDGLASSAGPDGSSASGPTDVVALPGGGLAITMGGSSPGVPRSGVQRQAATVLLARPHGHPLILADLQRFAAQHPQPGRTPDANPYGLNYACGTLTVADASENDVLQVSFGGVVHRLAQIPPLRYEGLEVDSVPTAVVAAPGCHHRYYAGELTGVPYPTGRSRLWLIRPGRTATVVSSGFSVVIDVASDGHGNLLVLQLAPSSLFDYPTSLPSGVLYRVSPDGRRTLLAQRGLQAPMGVAAGSDGSIYVVTHGTSPSNGEVVRVVPDASTIEGR